MHKLYATKYIAIVDELLSIMGTYKDDHMFHILAS